MEPQNPRMPCESQGVAVLFSQPPHLKSPVLVCFLMSSSYTVSPRTYG